MSTKLHGLKQRDGLGWPFFAANNWPAPHSPDDTGPVKRMQDFTTSCPLRTRPRRHQVRPAQPLRNLPPGSVPAASTGVGIHGQPDFPQAARSLQRINCLQQEHSQAGPPPHGFAGFSRPPAPAGLGRGALSLSASASLCASTLVADRPMPVSENRRMSARCLRRRRLAAFQFGSICHSHSRSHRTHRTHAESHCIVNLGLSSTAQGHCSGVVPAGCNKNKYTD